ncbi:MAG: helix-hairpin-helix domain-containing protein [bacterium]|nr:helix-hairpin-helix domain-containing protein [bacterium]
MSIDARTVLQIAGALAGLPLLLAVARFGLGWAPSAHATPPPGDPPRRVQVLRTPAPRAVVYVAGAVRHPGLVTLQPGARVSEALTRAVPRPDADLVAVNLAARVEDGEEIAVPVMGVPAARSRLGRVGGRSGGAGGSGRSRHGSHAPPHDLSLNTATSGELARVPGIGARLAARIIAYRETYGPFSSLDDLLDVNGVTARTLDRAAEFVHP